MQHTKKYELNLIEKTDTFSPDALNENMEKVEAALSEGLESVRAGAAAETAAEAAARKAADETEAAARAKADADETAARIKADADEAAARAAAVDALNQRVLVLEGHHVAFGVTTGRQMQLGFTPEVVFITGSATNASFTLQEWGSGSITIIDGGFSNKIGDNVAYLAWD